MPKFDYLNSTELDALAKVFKGRKWEPKFYYQRFLLQGGPVGYFLVLIVLSLFIIALYTGGGHNINFLDRVSKTPLWE